MNIDSAETVRRVPTHLGHLHARIVPGPGGDARTAVLWPSMFVDGRSFDRIVPLLSPHRTLIVLDPPGHGRSDAMTFVSDIEGAARAAREVLAELGVREPVDWIGEAFGGHVGYKLGRDDGRLRSLVTLASPPETNPEILRTTKAGLAVLALLGRGPLVKMIGEAQLTAAARSDPATYEVFRSGFLANTRRSMGFATRSFVLGRHDVRSELRDITVPTLIVHGSERAEWTTEGADAAAALIPGAKRADIAGASTLPSLEQPMATAKLILDFWAEVA